MQCPEGKCNSEGSVGWKKWSSKQSCGVWNCTRMSSLWHYFQRPYLGQKLERFSKYCSPFKNHQEQLNDLCAFNSLVPNPVLRLSDTGIESVKALYANPPHSFPAPSLGISLWSQENRYKPHPPRGSFTRALFCRTAAPRALWAHFQPNQRHWCAADAQWKQLGMDEKQSDERYQNVRQPTDCCCHEIQQSTSVW